jgi:hypothetical protein
MIMSVLNLAKEHAFRAPDLLLNKWPLDQMPVGLEPTA